MGSTRVFWVLAIVGCTSESPTHLPKPENTFPPAMIIMIGDGMGDGHLFSSSYYAHGEPGRLFIESLPHQGRLITSSLSGITGSGPSATAMATGVKSHHSAVGVDRAGQARTNSVELAHEHGMVAGIVTNTSLAHATPAGFSAHGYRHNQAALANSQILDVAPEVLLGAGSKFYLPEGPDSVRTDGGLIDHLLQSGYQVAFTAENLAAADPGQNGKLFGSFAPGHFDYVEDRTTATQQPTLKEMTLAALRFLETSDDGFFLMVEGGLIDEASHMTNIQKVVSEVIDFDETVRAVSSWADSNERFSTTLLVTADHETGGIRVVQPNGIGELPTVQWLSRGRHTNDQVRIFGSGPGTETFHGNLLQNTWVFSVTKSVIQDFPVASPNKMLVPDGRMGDLRHLVTQQQIGSGYGASHLKALWLDVDNHVLAIGVEGKLEKEVNALVVLLDVDLGASSGPAQLMGAINDSDGRIDNILSQVPLLDPGVSGFGADFAIVVWGGTDILLEHQHDDVGLRGLHGTYGDPTDLRSYGVACNFGEGVRTSTAQRSKEGWEAHVPLTTLYPDLDGTVPAGATIGISVILVSDDGALSNQALPCFPASTPHPGTTPTALPGVVQFVIDSNGDGVADGNGIPVVLQET